MPIELYWNMECKQMFQIETLQPYKKLTISTMPQKEILCLGAGGKTLSPASRSPEPLDEVTHRTSRGGNCELWGYKAIEGSDERTRKMKPPPPPIGSTPQNSTNG